MDNLNEFDINNDYVITISYMVKIELWYGSVDNSYSHTTIAFILLTDIRTKACGLPPTSRLCWILRHGEGM